VSATIEASGRSIQISHPERVVFPDAALTKLDLAHYYVRVAGAMVPHARNRPLALETFPSGIEGERYFAKNVPSHYPSWVATTSVPRREGGSIRQALANNAATLAYLVGQNMVTPHIWTSRADRLERPDRIVFDLDPSVEHFADVRATARELGALLRDLGFTPYAMTTGSRGIHVVVAIRRTADHDEVHAFSREVAALLASRSPDMLTVEFHRKNRGRRIYIDVARNGYGQHSVAPYAVRPLSKAPVATPLRWEELDDRRLAPQGWTVKTLPDRLAELGDPWRDIARQAATLGPARRALERLTAAS
jgi:bifunctional non-homologous end joining protein LigD